MNINQKPLAFIDTETTGLLSEKAEIIEFAGIKVWPDGRKEILHLFILPERIADAEPKALEVNGYTPEKWEANLARPMSEALPQIVAFLKNTIVVGQNVSFDVGMISAAIRRSGILDAKGRVPRIDYHNICTITLAYEHLVPIGLKMLNLISICKFLRIKYENQHTALADVQACMEVYYLLSRATAFRRFKWQIRHLFWSWIERMQKLIPEA